MPRIVDPHARRRNLAEAVWRLLARTGLEAMTVRDVAREAEVSTGTLAHYFDSKDQLIEFALGLAHQRAAERTLQAAAREPASVALRAVALENLPLDEARRAEYRAWLSFWSRALVAPHLQGGHAARYAAWRGLVTELLGLGQNDGSVRAGIDAAEEAAILVAFIDGLGVQALFEPRAFSRRQVVRLLDAQLGRVLAD